MSDKRKARPRLELHFSHEDGDVSLDVWNELKHVLQLGSWSPRLDQHVSGEHSVHDVARQVCWDALDDFANEAQKARLEREAEAAAEEKGKTDAAALGGMDDETKLASVDDAEALLTRLREVAPHMVAAHHDTARATAVRDDAEVDA